MDDSIYRLRYRDLLAICVFALLALGVIMVQSAGYDVTGHEGWYWSKAGTRDVIYVVLSAITFLIVGHFDYRKFFHPAARPELSFPDKPMIGDLLRQPIMWIYLTGVLCCLLVLVPHIGKEVNGARRWLALGPIQLQASEAGKWGCVLLFAWVVAARPLDLRRFVNFIAVLVPLGVVGLLVVKEDFGTAALIGLVVLAMLFVGRITFWHMLVILPPLAAGAVFFIAHEPYRLKRIMAFIDPFANPQQEGYHLIQSLLSYASGGIAGRGLGNGIQKLGYVPEDTTDFIFAIICEELGLFGAILIVLLYLGLIWACWNIVRQSRDSFGRILAFGVGTMIGVQAMLNIAVATVSVPPKGLPLPLVSYGGSGLVITSAMLGLVYSVGRIAEKETGNEALPLASQLSAG